VGAFVLAGAGCGGDNDAKNERGAAPEPPPFAPGGVWNAPLDSDAELDPRSDQLVAELLGLVEDNVERGNGPWINTVEFSAPVYTVPRDQAMVRVKLDNTEPDLQRAFEAVPIPAEATPADGTDKHMVIWQPSTDRMWEFWIAERKADGWHARFGGAMRNVSSNPGYFDTNAWPGAKPYWGATASSLPLLGGLIRIGEAEAGQVDHALAISLPRVRQGVWAAPAQRTDGEVPGPDAIPEGARFRLDPTLDVDGLDLPPLASSMAKAAQRYGIVVRDYAGVVAFVGEDPVALGPDTPDPWQRIYDGQLPSELLARFPWRRLQLLRMDLSEPTG